MVARRAASNRAPSIRILLLSGTVLLSACGADPDRQSSTRPSAFPPSLGAAQTVPMPLRQGPRSPTERLAEKVDPKNDIWDTESLAESTAAQLEILRGLIESRESPVIEHASGLIADGFVSQTLRPVEELDTVFADDLWVVRRWTEPSTSAGPTGSTASTASIGDHLGAPGLVDALRQLQDGLPGGSDIRAALKAYQIETSDSFFSTRVLVQASSRSAGNSSQWNASWLCRWTYPDDGKPPRLLAIALERYEEVSVRQRTIFTDATEYTLGRNAAYRQQVLPGIGHWLGRISRLSGVSLFGHHGLAIGDVNGDGLEDLYVADAGGLPNRLYVQNPDGTATEVSASARVDWLESTSSALLIDLDNDGDQDLVAVTRRMLLLAENDGSGRFTLHKPMRNVVASATSLAAADYDGDGDLDIYVCGYDGEAEHQGLPGPVPYHDANNGGANALLENRGGFEFVDVTTRTGLDANNTRYSFAAAWEDYDNDGDMDLYVANDFGRNNLYRNSGGHFDDVAAEAGVEDVASGMSVAWGDPDRNGWMDIYIGNMYSAAGNRVAYQRAFVDATGNASSDLQRMARGNTFFANDGTGTFRDLSEAAGVAMGRWAWSSRFADFNNDGWQDLVVANGYLTNDDTGDL